MEHQPKDPSGRSLFLVIGVIVVVLIVGVNGYKALRDKHKDDGKNPVDTVRQHHTQG